MDLAELYRRFGSFEVHGRSECYREWADGVAGDADLLGLIGELPGMRRQPQLVFAAARYAGLEPGPFETFRSGLIARWQAVREIVLARRNQTNEPGRCAALLPLLAALPQPLALLEVGASAGLCLYPERYSYRYGDRPVLDPPSGPSRVTLNCSIDGPVPVPTRLPTIVWRAGLDLNPLDVRKPDDVRWLQALIWPEQDDRRVRLAAAIELAVAEPPRLLRGDVNDGLRALAEQAPPEATLVIFHCAVMTYLDSEARQRLSSTVRSLPGHWLSLEGPSVAPLGGGSLPPSPDPTETLFVVEADGRPVAFASGQGQSLHWFE